MSTYLEDWDINLNQYWIDAKGINHKITDMSTSHLINSYKRCIAKQWRLYQADILLTELRSRGVHNTMPELFI